MPEDIGNIINQAFAHARPEVVTLENTTVIVTNDDGKKTLHDAEPFVAPLRERPRRLSEAITVRTPASLAAYMNLYAPQDHMAFVHSADPFSVRVVLDYHGAIDGDKPAAAAWGGHIITLMPRFAPAYAAWRKINRNSLGQREAMEFLEDRLIDVTKPDAADIMDMVMNFDGLTKVTFSSSQRLTDGRVQVIYKEEEADSGKVTFYDEMTLLVPVFEGAEPEPVKIRVRHRTRDGNLSFIFVIGNIEDLEQRAFQRMCDVWRTLLPELGAPDLREVAV